MPSLGRRIAAEFVGTAFLLAAIVGSGIMAETLSTDPGLQLLQNALATAGALTAMILALGPVSGAHLNPAVTLADRAFGGAHQPRDDRLHLGAELRRHRRGDSRQPHVRPPRRHLVHYRSIRFESLVG